MGPNRAGQCLHAFVHNHFISPIFPDQSFLFYKSAKNLLKVIHMMTGKLGVRDRFESKVHHFSEAMSFFSEDDIL